MKPNFLICIILLSLSILSGCGDKVLEEKIDSLEHRKDYIEKKLKTAKEEQGTFRSIFNDTDDVDNLQVQIKQLDEEIEKLTSLKNETINHIIELIIVLIISILVMYKVLLIYKNEYLIYSFEGEYIYFKDLDFSDHIWLWVSFTCCLSITYVIFEVPILSGHAVFTSTIFVVFLYGIKMKIKGHRLD